MFSLINVNKKFGGNVVLNNVSLDVNRGDVVAILGPSGSGTTAAKIAADLNMSARQIERMLADMKAKGIIRRIGANRNGYWEIVDD